MTRILLRAGKDPWLGLGPKETLARGVLGGNSGNLLFAEAVHRGLSVSGTDVVANRYAGERQTLSEDRVAEINEGYDAFVVPLANAFRPSFVDNLDRLTSLIRRLDMPVVVVGVGVQGGPNVTELHERVRGSARAFLTAVLDRSAKVGVRGEVTRRCLAALGFGDEHVDVIGCPSLLGADEVDVIKRRSELDTDSPIAVNVTNSQPAAGRIADRAASRYPRLTYVPQSVDELRLLIGEPPPSRPGKDTRALIGTDHQLYREGRVRYFLDARTWHDFMSTQQFAFGTRIHGNIAALSVGTPAYLLAIDARTLEIAEYHGIPHESLAGVADDVDPAELYDRADFSAFNARRPENFDRYLRFLRSNGLAHRHLPGDNPDYDGRLANAQLPPAVRPRGAERADTVTEQIEMSEHQTLAVLRSTPDVLEVEATWTPGGTVPRTHWHPSQTERFEVLEGELTVLAGDATRVYAAGESFEVPPRTAHAMWNAGAADCRASWRVTPALGTLEMFRTIDRARRSRARNERATEGANRDRGLNPLKGVAMLVRFRREFRLGRPR